MRSGYMKRKAYRKARWRKVVYRFAKRMFDGYSLYIFEYKPCEKDKNTEIQIEQKQ